MSSCNTIQVVRVKEEMVLSEAAYILFYVREDAPWFSSLMETHKDPNTSPKSVLETVESDCTAYPLAENSDICKANVNTGYIERTPFRCVLALEDNKMNQIGINTAQISCASKNPEAKLCYDKSSDDFPMNDAYFNEDKSGALPSHKINSVQIVHGIQRTDAMDPLVPPSSPNPGKAIYFCQSFKLYIFEIHFK